MKKVNTIVFFASPGGGKDTHSALLINYLESKLKEPVLYLGAGEEFRKLEKNHTRKIINKIMTDGALVPDFLVETIVGNMIMNKMTPRSHLVLNGFPRNVAQAKKLAEIAKFYKHKVKVVYIKVPPEEAVKRITNRSTGRSDDNEETIKKRFEIFEKENSPLEEYFKSNFELICIDGNDEKQKVHKKIVKALNINKTKLKKK